MTTEDEKPKRGLKEKVMASVLKNLQKAGESTVQRADPIQVASRSRIRPSTGSGSRPGTSSGSRPGTSGRRVRPSTSTGSRSGYGYISRPGSGNTDADRRRAINAYISGLIADSSLLTSAEAGATGPSHSGQYLKIRRRVNWQAKAKTASVTTNSGSIFPGALIVVDGNVTSLNPTILNVKRGKVNVRVEQFNGAVISGRDSIVADASREPSGSMAVAVDHAIDNILHDFYRSGVTIPPGIVDKTETFHSYKEAEFEMHASAGYAGASLKASYESGSNSCRSISIRDFCQKYYTVKADLPDGDYSQLFGDDVTVDMLRQKIRNNALLFVDSVTYGRRAYYCSEIETHSSTMLAKAEASYSTYFSADSKWKKSSQDIRFKSWFVLEGGNIAGTSAFYESVPGTNLSAGSSGQQNGKETTLDRIIAYQDEMRRRVNKYVQGGITIDRNTQGVILSYTTAFMTGNLVAAQFGNTGSYLEETVIPLHPVQILFRNRRDKQRYISVSWTEYTIGPDGIIRVSRVMNHPKTCVKGKSKLNIDVTKYTYQVKNIKIQVWDAEGDEITQGGNIVLEADNDYYPAEEAYYVVYWKNSMKTELLDKAHWDEQVGMEVDLG